MILVRHPVNGFDLALSACNGFAGVAVFVADGRLWRVKGCSKHLGELLAGGLGVWAFVPFDRKCIQGGLGMPPGVSHDSDSAVIDTDDFFDAIATGDGCGIEAFELASKHRAILDCGVQHARQLQVDAVHLRAGGFVEAAVNAGNPTWRILFVHLLPNCMRGALAQMPIRMAWAVRVSATLAFIGVGIQVPTPEWGAMIRQGSEFIISGEWWVSIVPGITLVLLVIGFSMLGDGFEEVLDPRRNTRAR